MQSPLIKNLRARDYERYLCALMEPASRHPRLFALLALNQELASAVWEASEPHLAAVRIKWWQEALQKGDDASHPLLAHLQPLALSAQQIEMLITPRFMELEAAKGYENSAAFDAYLRASGGGLHALLAEDENEIIMAAGAFYALVGTLRSLPYALERGRVPLPLDWLRAHGISPAAIEAGVEKEVYSALMQHCLEQVHLRAEALSQPIKTAPRLIKRLHLSALLYAKALQRCEGHPERLPRRLPNLPLRLWLAR